VSADLGETPEGTRERWRSAVAGVLARSGRPEAAEEATPERLLDSPTGEGFSVRALYTAFDELPEQPLPGEWPFVRGSDPHRDVLAGWKVAEEFPAPGSGGSVQEANAAILDALVDGVSALVLRVGPDGIPAASPTSDIVRPRPPARLSHGRTGRWRGGWRGSSAVFRL